MYVQETVPSEVRKIILEDNDKIKLILKRTDIYLEDEHKGLCQNIYLDYIPLVNQQKALSFR